MTDSRRIPKIKKQKDNIQSVDINNRDVQNLLREVNKTCLDTEFQREWEAVGVSLIHNTELEDRFIKKRGELKDEGRTAASLQEQLGFLVVRPSSKTAIINNGLKATKQFFNRLGNGESGVYINRYFDIELKSCWKPGDVSKEIFVFKYFHGKRKAITITTNTMAVTESSLDPTPNYDCHTSSVQPKKEDPSFRQNALSSIYLYEYTDACVPAKYPRQCLPTAIIECKKRLVVPKPNPQILSKKENQSGAAQIIPSLVAAPPSEQNSPVVNNDVVVPPSLSQKPTQLSVDMDQNILVEHLKSPYRMRPSDPLFSPPVPRSSSNDRLITENYTVKKLEKRSIGSMEALIQQTPQYIERLNGAFAKMEQEKISRSTSLIDSILPDTRGNPVNNLPGPSVIISSKCTQSSTNDIRDPRLVKASTKPLDKKGSCVPVEKNPSSSSTSPRSKKLSSETKKMSYSEYLKVKAGQKCISHIKGGAVGDDTHKDILSLKGEMSSKISPNASVQNHPLRGTSSPLCNEDLSKFQSPQARMQSNSEFYSQFQSPIAPKPSVSQNLFQSAIPPWHPLSQNLFQSTTPPQHSESQNHFQSPIPTQHSVSQNLFQSFLLSNSVAEPVAQKNESTAPSSSPSILLKARQRVEKKTFLPLPVLCEDGSVKNVYRHTIDGSVTEIPSSTSSSPRKCEDETEKTELCIAENDTPSPNVKEGAHKLFKAFQNVFADDKKKKLIEKQLSNGKKEELVNMDQNLTLKDCPVQQSKSDPSKKQNDRKSVKNNSSVPSSSNSSVSLSTGQFDDQRGKERFAGDEMVISQSQKGTPPTVDDSTAITGVRECNSEGKQRCDESVKKTEKKSTGKECHEKCANDSGFGKSVVESRHEKELKKKKDMNKELEKITKCKRGVVDDMVKDMTQNACVSHKISALDKSTLKCKVKSDKKHVTKRSNSTTSHRKKVSVELQKSAEQRRSYVKKDARDKGNGDDPLVDKENKVDHATDILKGNDVPSVTDVLKITSHTTTKDHDIPTNIIAESVHCDENLLDSYPTGSDHLSCEHVQRSPSFSNNFDDYPKFVCRSPNADIPGINFSLDLSAQITSSKSYCSPLRLIPSLCSDNDAAEPANASTQECEAMKTDLQMPLDKTRLSPTQIENLQVENELEKQPVRSSSRECSPKQPCGEDVPLERPPVSKLLGLSQPLENAAKLSADVQLLLGSYAEKLSSLTTSFDLSVEPRTVDREKDGEHHKVQSASSGSKDDQPSVSQPKSTVSDYIEPSTSNMHSRSSISEDISVHFHSASGSQQDFYARDLKMVSDLSCASDKKSAPDLSCLSNGEQTFFQSVISSQQELCASDGKSAHDLYSSNNKQKLTQSATGSQLELYPNIEKSATDLSCSNNEEQKSPSLSSSSSCLLIDESFESIPSVKCQGVPAMEESMKNPTITVPASPSHEEDVDVLDSSRLLSLEELGFSFYLQVLSDRSYQPSIVVVDFKEAQDQGYHHNSCNTCRKELTPDVTRYINETTKDDSCSEAEQSNVQVSDTAVNSNDRPPEIQEKVLGNRCNDSASPVFSNSSYEVSAPKCFKWENHKDLEVSYLKFNRGVIKEDLQGPTLPIVESLHCDSGSKRLEKDQTIKLAPSPIKDPLERYHSYKASLMKRQRERNQLRTIREKLLNKGVVGSVKRKLPIHKNQPHSTNIEDDDELRDSLLDDLLHTSSNDGHNTVRSKVKTACEDAYKECKDKSIDVVSQNVDLGMSKKAQLGMNSSTESDAKPLPLDLFDMIENDPCGLGEQKSEAAKQENKNLNISMVPRSAQKFLKKKETVPPRKDNAPHSHESRANDDVSQSLPSDSNLGFREKSEKEAVGKEKDVICGNKLENQALSTKWKPIKESKKESDIDKLPLLSNDIHVKPLTLPFTHRSKFETKTHTTAGVVSNSSQVHEPTNVMDHTPVESLGQSTAIAKENECASHSGSIRGEELRDITGFDSANEDKKSNRDSPMKKNENEPESCTSLLITKKPSAEDSGTCGLNSSVLTSNGEQHIKDKDHASVRDHSLNVDNFKSDLDVESAPPVGQTLKSPDLSLYLNQPLGDVDYRAGLHFGKQNIGLPTKLSFSSGFRVSEACKNLSTLQSGPVNMDCFGDVDYRNIRLNAISNSGQCCAQSVTSDECHQQSVENEFSENVIGSDRKLLIWPSIEPAASDTMTQSTCGAETSSSRPIGHENPPAPSMAQCDSTSLVTPVCSTHLSSNWNIEFGTMTSHGKGEKDNAKGDIKADTVFSTCISDSKPQSDHRDTNQDSEVEILTVQKSGCQSAEAQCNPSSSSSVSSITSNAKSCWVGPSVKCNESGSTNQSVLPQECSRLNKNDVSPNPGKTLNDEYSGNVMECKEEDSNNAVENIRQCFPDIIFGGKKQKHSEIITYMYSEDEESDEDSCPSNREENKSVQLMTSEDFKQNLESSTKIDLSQDHLSMLKRAINTVTQSTSIVGSSSSLGMTESLNKTELESQKISLSNDDLSMLKKAINTVTQIVPAATCVADFKEEVVDTQKVNLTPDQLSMLKKTLSTFTHSAPVAQLDSRTDSQLSGQECKNNTKDMEKDYLKKSMSQLNCVSEKCTDRKEKLDEDGYRVMVDVKKSMVEDSFDFEQSMSPFPSVENHQTKFNASESKIVDKFVHYLSETLVETMMKQSGEDGPVVNKTSSPKQDIVEEDDGQQKVLLSDVPLEALTQAKMHVLEQLESLKDLEEDENNEHEEALDSSEKDKASISSDDESTELVEERNQIVSISSDSEADELQVSFKNRRISKESTAREIILGPNPGSPLSQKVKEMDIIEINSSASDRSSVSSPIISRPLPSPTDDSFTSSSKSSKALKFPALKISLSNSSDDVDKMASSNSNRRVVVTSSPKGGDIEPLKERSLHSISQFFKKVRSASGAETDRATDEPQGRLPVDLPYNLSETVKDCEKEPTQETEFTDSERSGEGLVKRNSSHLSSEARLDSKWRENENFGISEQLRTDCNDSRQELWRKKKRGEHLEHSLIDRLYNLSPSIAKSKRRAERDDNPPNNRYCDISPNVMKNRKIELSDDLALKLKNRYRNSSPEVSKSRRKDGEEFFPNERYRNSSPDASRYKTKEDSETFSSEKYQDLSPEVSRYKRNREDFFSKERYQNSSPGVARYRTDYRREFSSSERYRDLSPEVSRHRRKDREEFSSGERYRNSSPEVSGQRRKHREEFPSNERHYDLSPEMHRNRKSEEIDKPISSNRYQNMSPEFFRSMNNDQWIELSSCGNQNLSRKEKDDNNRRDQFDGGYRFVSLENCVDGNKEERDNNCRMKLHSLSPDCDQKEKYSRHSGASPISSCASDYSQFEDPASPNKKRKFVSAAVEGSSDRRVILGRRDSSVDGKQTTDRRECVRQHSNSRHELRGHSDNSSYSGSDSLCSNQEVSYSSKMKYSQISEHFSQRSNSPPRRSLHRKEHDIPRGRSDLVDYFTSSDDPNRINRNAARIRSDTNFNISRIPSRGRQHPLDELLEPLRKRRVPDGEDELDYYIHRKRTNVGRRNHYNSSW